MPDVMGAAREIQARLEQFGIRAALAESDLSTDGVLLTAPVLTARMGGCWDAVWTAYLLVGNTGREAELAAGADLLDPVAEILGFTTAEPVEIQSVDGGRRPGWKITFTSRIQ
jgi:hypothetical protein